MENNRPNVLKVASLPQPKLPQNSIVNKDGSTIHVLEAGLIRLLSEKLQVQCEILTPSDGAFGTRQPDGNWTGLMGMIVRSEADLAMADVFLTEDRHQAANFTFPLTVNRITFMTDKLQPVSKNLAILQPFSCEVWIDVSLLFGAVALLLYLLMNKKVPLQRVLLVIFGSIFGQPIDFQIKTNALKLLASAWILGVMILNYSYKAVLLSFLSFPTLGGIRDIPDLAAAASTDRSFKCFTYRGSYLIGNFLQSQDASWKAIGQCLNRNQVQGTGDVFEAFHLSASKKAFVGSSYGMRSYSKDYFISEDTFSIVLGGIPFSRKFCCPDRLNAVVHRILASGLLGKITGQKNFLAQLRMKSLDSDVSEKEAKIQLGDISGAFYILMSGWLMSFMVFLVETSIAKYQAN